MKILFLVLLIISSKGFAANEYKQPNAAIFYNTLSLPLLNAAGIVTNTSGGLLGTTSSIGISNGGTGQITKTAAFNALSPNSTLGDITYFNGTNNVRLGGNTTSSKYILTQTGTGTVSAAPSWGLLTSSDIPDISAIYLKRDGSTALIGNWDNGGVYKITNLIPNFISTLQYNSSNWFYESGTGATENFWLGQGASSALTTGTGNFVINGGAATNTLTSGSRNFLIGNKAMPALTTNSDNLAIGSNIWPTGDAQQNTLIGNAIAINNGGGKGERNVCLGYASCINIGGSSSTSGAHNVMIGYNTGAAIGLGSGNTVLGYGAGGSVSAGTNNTMIGISAGPSGDYSNTVAIGNGAAPSASNMTVIGNSSTTSTLMYGVMDVEGNKITNLGAPTASTDAATRNYVDTVTTYIKADGSRVLTANWDVGGVKLTNLSDPGSAQHAATKNYVDTAIKSMASGGTNANLTAAAGAVAYSTSTGIALTAAGTSGQVLTSNGSSAPTWQAVTSGTGLGGWGYFTHGHDCTWTSTSATYVDGAAVDTTCTFTNVMSSNLGTCTSYNDGTGGHNWPGFVCTGFLTKHYKICASIEDTTTVAGDNEIRLYDGTTQISQFAWRAAAATTYDTKTTCGMYSATAGTVTIKLQTKTSSGTVTMAPQNTDDLTVLWTVLQLD